MDTNYKATKQDNTRHGFDVDGCLILQLQLFSCVLVKLAQNIHKSHILVGIFTAA